MSNAGTLIPLAPIHFKVTNLSFKNFQLPKLLLLNMTRVPSSQQSSVVSFSPNPSHNPQNLCQLFMVSDDVFENIREYSDQAQQEIQCYLTLSVQCLY